MSEEIRLPAELAACEARLAAHAPPASGIDRDALLYQAGWTAALAHAAAVGGSAEAAKAPLAAVDPPPLKGGARGGISRTTSTIAWSSLSAALAASIAVAATLELRPPRLVDVAAEAELPASTPVRESQPPADIHLAKRSERGASPVRIAPLRPEFQAGLLGLRQQALADMLKDRPGAAASSATSGGAPATKTVRELMDELLPQDADRSAHLWPWSRLAPGDSI